MILESLYALKEDDKWKVFKDSLSILFEMIAP